MRKLTMHAMAAALGLLLSVPAAARAQDVKDLRPAARTAASDRSASFATPAPTTGQRPAATRPQNTSAPDRKSGGAAEKRAMSIKHEGFAERRRKHKSGR